MSILSDWKFWIVLISVVIGTIIGMFIIPQTKQNMDVIKEVEKSTVEVIFIDVVDEKKLEEIVYSYFDEKQYKISVCYKGVIECLRISRTNLI